MTEMEERVAKALYLHETKHAREQFPGPDGWDDMLSERGRQMWRGKAAIAIEAMREPTQEMLEVGEASPYTNHAMRLWRQMIDAARGKISA